MVDRYFEDAGLAALYDALSPPAHRADFAFYLPFIMSAASVLDIGCGTGALLANARSGGHDGRLCGLDPGQGMIEQARRQAGVEWVLGDLTSAAWDQVFDLAVMTGHAFQVFLGDDELQAALDSIRALLKPGGRFAFETRNPGARPWEYWDGAGEVTGPDGRKVGIARATEHPFDGRTLAFSHTFTVEGWDRAEVSHSVLRFLGAAELDGFLEAAGFEIEGRFGDWGREPLAPDSPEIITIARRAA